MALWSRLERFATGALSRLIASRTIVRMALMRSTIHLVTASDCAELRPLAAAGDRPSDARHLR